MLIQLPQGQLTRNNLSAPKFQGASTKETNSTMLNRDLHKRTYMSSSTYISAGMLNRFQEQVQLMSQLTAQLQSEKSFGKLRLRAFQPYHQILCMSKISKIISISDISNML